MRPAASSTWPPAPTASWRGRSQPTWVFLTEVIASDGTVNLIGANKLQHLEQRFAVDGFDYIGNALPDLPLLQGARQAMLANPDLRLNSALKSRNITVSRKFLDRSRLPGALARALRVHQWAKNLLVFLPLLLAHSFRAARCWPRSRLSSASVLLPRPPIFSTTCSIWNRTGCT